MTADRFDIGRYEGSHWLVLVFAPSSKSPPYQEQVRLFEAVRTELESRDIVVAYVLHEGQSVAGGSPVDVKTVSTLRDRFGVGPEAFGVVLVGPDGTERKRYTAPVKTDALFEAIDARTQ